MELPLEIEQIRKILPQNYPFLFIDRVIDLVPQKKAVAIKNVSINDNFFEGHFPGQPIMPGTLIIEALAQTSILIYHSAYEGELKEKPSYYLGSVKARFLHPVVPGDQLRLEAEAAKVLSTGAFINTKAFVGEKLVVEAELIFVVKR
ncbi:MAG: 3-hydroxyacyl-ACP dehydratase FabZ [Candidatus Omnitrophota bacterium]